MSRSARKSKRPDPTVGPVIYNPLRDNRPEMRMRFTPSRHREDARIYASAARAVNHMGTRFHGIGVRSLRKIAISGRGKLDTILVARRTGEAAGE